MRDWLERATDAELLAASVGNDPSLGDIIRMVHPKPGTEARAALEAMNPQNRLIQPSEVTATALFLCGAGSDGINCQAITIAGGVL